MQPKKLKKEPITLKFLTISMASLLCLSLILFFTLSSATHRAKPPSPKPSMASVSPEIHQACKATRYPSTCELSLVESNRVPQNPNPFQIIQSAIWVSSQKLKTAQSMVQTILDSAAGNPNRTFAAKNCLEALHNSDYRLASTSDALPRGKIKDARAWMSAGLAYQYDCWSALKYVNDSQLINKTMAFMDSLIGLSSNALSMVVSYDIFGNETASWAPPKTERAGFWEGVGGAGGGSGSGYKGGFPSGMTADVTVCKGGGGGANCDYNTVQEAVNAAPDNQGMRRFVIRIKEGVYEETVRVPLEKKNVVFLGDGMGKTVITGSLHVGPPGISTYNTATVGKWTVNLLDYWHFRN